MPSTRPATLTLGRLPAIAFAVALCANAGCAPRSAPVVAPVPVPVREPTAPCGRCATVSMSPEIAGAIRARITDLAARGGDCLAEGKVLERSLASGRIAVRPYMWRVGPHLASAEAKPDGELEFAREIDSLNVGVRTLDDVLWSVEHEAVHVAFHIPSGQAADEDSVDQHIRECRRGSALRGAP